MQSAAAQALRLVRHARIELSVPLCPGPLLPGLQVLPGTTAAVELSVHEGIADLANARVQLVPPLDGPLFTSVEGLSIGSDGRATLRLRGLPDIKLGPQLPARLSEIADRVEQADGEVNLAVRVLGVRLGSINVNGGEAMAAAQDVAQSDAPGSPILERARLGVLEVELQRGVIMLGPGLSAEVSDGCAFRLSGTAEQLHVTGHLVVEGVQLRMGQLSVEDARGAAEVTFDWQRDPEGGIRWSARLEHADLRTGHAHVPGTHQDFFRFESLSATGCHLELRDQRSLDLEELLRDFSFADLHLSAAKFEAELSGGFLSVAPEERNSDVVLGRARAWGKLSTLAGQPYLEGEVELDARLRELQSPGDVLGLVLSDAHLTGKAHLRHSMTEGLSLRGEQLRLQTDIEHAQVRVRAGRNSAQAVHGSSGDLRIHDLTLTPGGDLHLEGDGTFSFKLGALELPFPQLRLLRHDARLKVQGEVMLDTRRGLELREGKLQLDAEAFEADVQLGQRATLRADGRYKLKAAGAKLTALGDQLRLAWGEGSTFSADLQRGTVSLSESAAFDLRRGTKAHGKIDRLELAADAPALIEASGKLQAQMGSERDLAEVARLFGVDLGRLSAASQELELTVGTAEYRDGRFQVRDAKVGLTAHIDELEGALEGAVDGAVPSAGE